jgi:hypothetical protein
VPDEALVSTYCPEAPSVTLGQRSAPVTPRCARASRSRARAAATSGLATTARAIRLVS